MQTEFVENSFEMFPDLFDGPDFDFTPISCAWYISSLLWTDILSPEDLKSVCPVIQSLVASKGCKFSGTN